MWARPPSGVSVVTFQLQGPFQVTLWTQLVQEARCVPLLGGCPPGPCDSKPEGSNGLPVPPLPKSVSFPCRAALFLGAIIILSAD